MGRALWDSGIAQCLEHMTYVSLILVCLVCHIQSASQPNGTLPLFHSVRCNKSIREDNSSLPGVKGVILYEDSRPAAGLTVTVDGRMPVTTTPLGEFWKLILAGNHNITVSITDLYPIICTVTIDSERLIPQGSLYVIKAEQLHRTRCKLYRKGRRSHKLNAY